MATLPIIDSAPLQTSTGRRGASATPDAFGAQEARGVGQVAQALDRASTVASEIDDDFNEANALELDNELSRRVRDRLYNPETGFLATERGINAVNNRATVERELDEMAAELATRARNPRAAALYQNVARRRLASALGDVSTHVATQARSYQNEQSEGRIQEALDNAVAAYADPAVVAANMATATGELERIREREGWSPEIYQSRVRQLQSDMSARVIVQLASTDPDAAQEMYDRIRPGLSAQEAGELLTTMRAAVRQGQEDMADQAWVYVSNGQAIPPELWNSLPGAVRIDIQNERRRRAENGPGTGDRELVDALDIMPDEEFARANLWAVRGSLGSQYRRMVERQRGIRDGSQSSDVTRQRTTFNALRDIAQTTLNIDLSPTEAARRRDSNTGARADAFNAALLREVESFTAANPGAAVDSQTAQILIGRAYVGMQGNLVSREQGRVRGVRGRTRTSQVQPTTEAVVPYSAIPENTARRLGTTLQRRLGRAPTRGEVENAYSAILAADPRTREEVDTVLNRIVIGGE